jgi:hypothetical protein
MTKKHTIYFATQGVDFMLNSKQVYGGSELRAWKFARHGLGDQHLQRRLAFTDYAAANLAELGFDYSDCTADLRPYHLVFQDCDVDPVNGKRAIYSEMETLPPLMRYGHNYLVLTHPCYWKR